MSAPASIELTSREGIGRNSVRKLRFQNPPMVPGIVYGQGSQPSAVMTKEDTFARTLAEGNHLVMVDDGKGGEQPAVIKEVQYDVYGERILHFDLWRIDKDDKVEVEIPLRFVGELDSPGSQQGGVVQKVTSTAKIRCNAMEVPANIRVNLSKIQLGQTLLFSDLEMPAGVELASNPKANVASCKAPRRKKK